MPLSALSKTISFPLDSPVVANYHFVLERYSFRLTFDNSFGSRWL